VISSDKPPKAILTLEDRLRSRFEWGLIADVQPPDLETRTAILRAKADQMNVYVPDEVLDFLAHKVQSNIRELEGSLNRLVAFANMHGLSLSVECASVALADLIGSARRKRISTEMIIQAVSEHYGVDLKSLTGRGRSRNIVVPRQVAMYLLREETESSLVDIGNMLGGRDHTTVMYGCEKIAEEINADNRLRSEVLAIREKLHAQSS
jgi:chromosomal replication initiator protein